MKGNFLLIIVVCVLIVILICMPAFQIVGNELERNFEDKIYLTLWHVDSFEGGQNSRKTFLNNTAISFQKENENIYVIIKNLTVTGYLDLLRKGQLPDILSFGTGVSRDTLGYLQPYTGRNIAKENFLDVGTFDNKCYAIPWAYSGYFLVGGGKELIYGVSDESNPMTALYSYMKSGNEIKFNTYSVGSSELTTKDAYSTWIDSESVLLGVNRDIVRMENYINNGRLKEQEVIPLSCYADLFCMIGITKDSTHYEESVKFIEYLTTDEIQRGLANLKLLSPIINIYECGYMKEYEESAINIFARNVFMPYNDWENNVAINAIKGDKDSSQRIKDILE